MQGVFFAMLIHALHSAFDDRVVAFNRVGRYDVVRISGITRVFLAAMVDRIMPTAFARAGFLTT